MSTAAFTRLFAVLSLLTWAGTLTTIGLAALHRRNPESSAGYLFEDVRRNSVWIAFVIALVTMLGSLYLSEIAHYHPCPLCWYQRICMYPLSVALLVGALRKDRMVWTYVLPPAIIGAGFAIYHTQLQAFPKQHGPFCKIDDPCTVRFVWEFGFVSIPFMALAAFVFIITMMFVLRSEPSEDELELESPDASSDPDDAPALSAQGAS
jgi:disulfide bond formation protein DsbB